LILALPSPDGPCYFFRFLFKARLLPCRKIVVAKTICFLDARSQLLHALSTSPIFSPRETSFLLRCRSVVLFISPSGDHRAPSTCLPPVPDVCQSQLSLRGPRSFFPLSPQGRGRPHPVHSFFPDCLPRDRCVVIWLFMTR